VPSSGALANKEKTIDNESGFIFPTPKKEVFWINSYIDKGKSEKFEER